MKKQSITLLIILLVTSCIALNKDKIKSWAMGKKYFHDQSLGQPTKTAIPYALWLAMMEKYPDELGESWDELSKKFGLITDYDQQNQLPIGFAVELDDILNTQFLATNCSLCHTAKINNKIINGLGARSLKLNALNNVVMNLAKKDDFTTDNIMPVAYSEAKKHNLNWDWRTNSATKMAIKELKKRSTKYADIDAGPGRNTPIEFAKVATGVEVDKPFGYVRFPPVWNYKKRQTFGWDASMKGDLALAAASVEFNKGMSVSYIINHQDRWQNIYDYVATIESPKFPDLIDRKLASNGKKIYSRTCYSCHGNNNIYEEKVIPLEIIKTDPDRLKSMTKELVSARNSNKFGKLVPLEISQGYVAPPLDGIWSRAPYLHNGSVPTLEDLLKSADERPKIFYINFEKYDFKKVGVSYRIINSIPKKNNQYYEFNTSLEGNSNAGHNYGINLSNAEKIALIEYLKQF
jgi:hypothetical protein